MIQESDAIHAKILKKNEIRRNKSDCLDHMTSGHSVGLRPQEIGSHESHLERKCCTFTLVSHTAQMKSNCLYYGDKKKHLKMLSSQIKYHICLTWRHSIATMR